MPSLTKQFQCSMLVSLSKEFKASLSASLGDSTVSTMSDSELRDFLSPKPEDYVMIPMRALSADAVQGNTINFAHLDGQPLMDAVGMFNGLIILKDHDQTVDNWVGQTQDAYWDTSIPNVPPGVNFMLKVDTKADPKLARGLLSGMVTSGSVTIQFDHEKSHPKMEDYEFYSQLGTTVKGKVVQALVTKVTRCFEYSIVWQGADNNAKKINPDGTIDKPGLALNTTEEQMLKKLALMLGLSETATEDEVNAAVAAKLAAEAAAKLATETQVATLTATLATKDTEIAALTAKATDSTTVSAQVITLTAENTALKTQVTTLTTKQAAFEAHVVARRTEAKRLYLLAEGDKALEPMKAAIDNAELAVAESFVTTFGAKVEAAMPLQCTKCKSTELSRRVSAQSETIDTAHENTVVPMAAHIKASVTSIHG